MKRITRFLALGVAITLPFCSPEEKEPEPKQDSAAINQYLSTIPDWTVEEIEPLPDVELPAVKVKNAAETEEFECPVIEHNLVRTVNNFVAVGTNFGKIWPGAMIQGKSLETGDLQLINTKRTPVTLVTNIALKEVSETIVPNSVNAQQAIANFMLAAGEMPEGSQAGAGTMLFQVEEAITFEQSMLSMGVTAGFTDPQSSVGLEGSLSVSATRKKDTHTVVAKFVQEMFTVRVADDLIATPADFFGADFTSDDLEAMKTSGVVGPENIPLYIESVTYGRIMIFSMTSSSVSSSNELSAALEGSMADYAKVGGEFEGSNEQIFKTASHKIFSAGGTDQAANEAVANLDWSKFFQKSPASTAVPISFVARTLNGKKIVSLVQSETFQRRADCEGIVPENPATKSYEVTVKWTATSNTGLCIGGGTWGTCTPMAFVSKEKELGSPTVLTALNSYTRTMRFDPDANGDGDFTNDPVKFTIISQSNLKGLFGSLTFKVATKTFNVTNMGNSAALEHKFTNAVGSVTLKYTITRKEL